MPKVILTGGGTMGHVIPNLVIAKGLMEEGYEIVYIGSSNTRERASVEDAKIGFYKIPTGKLRRYASFKNFLDVFKIIAGVFCSIVILIKERPDVLFGKGGYVAVPVVMAAYLLRVPVIIHESDLTMGLANKICKPFAKAICYSFKESEKYIGSNKSIHTGLPIRRELFEGQKDKGFSFCGFDQSRPVVLIMGGSQGSKAINKTLFGILDEMLESFQVCHISGRKQNNDMKIDKKGYREFGYIGAEMGDVYSMADVVAGRAGATSIMELLALYKPNVLIPISTGSSRGDQIKNAQLMEKKGLSTLINEEDLCGGLLLDKMIFAYENRHEFISRMKEETILNAEERIIEVIIKYTKRKKK